MYGAGYKLGWSKNPVSSQTDKLMAGTFATVYSSKCVTNFS